MENNEKSKANDLSAFSAQITDAIESAAQSIVAVDARPRVRTSGIVWREGIVVSTNHTIERDQDITVVFGDGQTAQAALVGRDAGTDLAVLKIADDEIAKSVKPAEIIGTSNVKVGNLVLAVGKTSADGGAATASFGIVNQTGGAWRTWRGDEIERFIGLDLAVILGFSGGALINTGGQVLGVNTSAFGRGLALTVPSETVNRVVDRILAKGKISKPYLGIATQAVPLAENLREKLNLEQTSGLMMLTVEQGGAAENGGVLIGDVLLSLDEQPTLDPSDVQRALWGKEAGNAVRAKLLRAGGEIKQIEIILAERPAPAENEGRRGRGRSGWRGGRRGC